MGHPFEQHRQADVPATRTRFWAAIASGPGIDSWFIGRSAVQPGADSTVRTVFGEYAPELGVTAWIRRAGSPTAAARPPTDGSSRMSS